jgi:NodT family efflux transporter outer membrane factor (OMF) lipoprotein
MPEPHLSASRLEPSRSRPGRVGAALVCAGVLTTALALSGCATPSAHQRPALIVPERFTQDPGANPPGAPIDAAVVASLSPWWQAIDDAALSGLITEALRRNNDLALAAIRVRRAQLVAGQAESDRLPEVSLRASSTATRAVDGGPTTRVNSVTAGVSWELDLWGRLASLSNAADWEAQATEQDRQAAALALVGTTANLHWQVAYLNQRVQVSQQSIDYARRTLELVQAQHRTGVVSGLEVAQATQSLANQEAAHTQLLLQRTQARNALAILFDRPPGALPNEPQRLPDGALPGVPPGVPADLLVRRPDLRAAELRLRKTLAQVDATRRSFYPVLTLTGSVGGSSSALSQVLADPVSTLGAGLLLPFVQWRDMQRNVAISEVDHELAVVGFRQSWYAALSDVDNALASRQQLEQQGLSLQAALDAALTSERLSEARYRAGAVPLKTWLDAQEARRQIENSLALNRLNRLNALVTLYQSLGGGVEG